MNKVKTLTDVLNDPKSFTSRASKIIEARLTKKEQTALEKSLRASRRKTKINLNNIPERDQAQTPPYALLPLLPYLPKNWTVWESGAGMGLLAEAISALNGNFVWETDLLTGYDFFKYQPDQWDIQVTNPPWSFPIKYDWIERSYDLNKPFALLLPFETWAAARAQARFQQHGMNIIMLNRRVNFYMPYKGWEGKGSDFPVAWFCWGLPNLKEPVTYGHIPNPSPKAGLLPKWMVTPLSRNEIRKGAMSVSNQSVTRQAANPISVLAYGG